MWTRDFVFYGVYLVRVGLYVNQFFFELFFCSKAAHLIKGFLKSSIFYSPKLCSNETPETQFMGLNDLFLVKCFFSLYVLSKFILHKTAQLILFLIENDLLTKESWVACTVLSCRMNYKC